MRDCAALVVIVSLLLAGVLRADEPAASGQQAWKAELERARIEGKALVVFTRPPDCRDDRLRYDPCKAFEDVLVHPAIVRRLDRIVFLSIIDPVERPSITIYDPGGRQAIRWSGAPRGVTFRQMLNLVDGATEHLIACYRARRDGDEVVADREALFASFALGDEALGRAQLRQLGESENEESRQLATIWGARLDAQGGDLEPDEVALRALAAEGSTDKVRFEAWMTIAELERAAGRREEATAVYRKAIPLAPEPSKDRDVAMTLLQRTTASALPVAGLGSPGSATAGRRTLQPLWNEKETARVEYRLDGRLVATSRKPPFAAGVNFGRLPKRQGLTISAIDGGGRVIRSAGMTVNDRTDALAIEIVEPASPVLSGTTDVEVSLRVPRGRTTRGVVIEWNGVTVAHLTAPPYRARIDAKEVELGILRAAARLDDGSEVEDVRLFNTSDMILETEVHLVEVPVYSSNRRLTADDVVVKEAGVVRPVDRVIAAADAPLVVALVLDVSKSMEDWVLHLEEAALEFVESLNERDRVMVVAFDSVARVALWPTSDRARIERAIQHLSVKGATALDDAMILSLLQLQSIGSRRAMVVMSDGWDNSSVFSQDDVEEVARRSAVPIYVLTLNPRYDRPPSPVRRDVGRAGSSMPLKSRAVKEQVRFGRLGGATGGDSFTLRSLGKLGSYWSKISDDLSRQSIVIYHPSPTGPTWRPIDVSLRRGGALRAPSGVYVEVDQTKDAPEP
jgi:VWFA-related protein